MNVLINLQHSKPQAMCLSMQLHKCTQSGRNRGFIGGQQLLFSHLGTLVLNYEIEYKHNYIYMYYCSLMFYISAITHILTNRFLSEIQRYPVHFYQIGLL